MQHSTLLEYIQHFANYTLSVINVKGVDVTPVNISNRKGM